MAAGEGRKRKRRRSRGELRPPLLPFPERLLSGDAPYSEHPADISDEGKVG